MISSKTYYVIGLFLSPIILSRCSFVAEDGDWDPIQITVNGNKCKSSTYAIPVSGGEYKIFSKNYGSLWLNTVKENGLIIWPKYNEVLDFKDINLTDEWYKVKYDETGNIVVDIEPIDNEVMMRSLTFDVQHGDAFGSITLQQE